MTRNEATTKAWATLASALVLGVIGALVPAMAPASGVTTDCNNEPRIDLGGDDFLLDVGPGIAYVGVDTGNNGTAGACAGVPSNGIAVTTKTDRHDTPRAQQETSCLFYFSGCKVNGYTVWADDGDANELTEVHRSGLPAGNGSTTVPSPGCVMAVGAVCP